MKNLFCACLTAVIAGSVSAQSEVSNLRGYFDDLGFDISTLVDGGTAGKEYNATYGVANAFDGVCEGGSANRWLGEINAGAYLKFSLPEGYSCKVDSYKLWQAQSAASATVDEHRVPFDWEFIGITVDGTEYVLSSVIDNKELSGNLSLSVSISPADERRYVAFKWVPSKSYTMTTQSPYTWSVGLSELEIFVKDISNSLKGATWNLRNFLIAEGFDVGTFIDGGSSSTKYPVGNTFDGIYEGEGVRWLGEIKDKTYLRVMLPAGYSCDVGSYKMWRLNAGYNIEERTPTQWELFGITKHGEEVSISTGSIGIDEFMGKDHVIVPVEPAEAGAREFIGFKWAPLASPGNSIENLEYTVGLMEFEIFVKNISAPSVTGVYNLLDCRFDDGLEVTVNGGTAGTHYHASFSYLNAFDRVCVLNDTNKRWLGSIGNGTFLEYRLPQGYSCEIDSYAMWRLCSNDSLYTSRAPTKWTLYGITSGGGLVPVSSTGQTENKWLQQFSRLMIEVPSAETQGRRFTGFKWVPEYSKRCEAQDEVWNVGLMEFEVFVKNVSLIPRGTAILVR